MMEELKFTKYQRGQTLVEVIIALALATVVITALLSTTLSSLSNAERSQSQNEATQYSQEGLEVLRSLSNIGGPSTYCLDENSKTLTSGTSCPTPNVATKYIRKVKIEAGNVKCGDSKLESVQVITSWDDGKCGGTYCKSSTLQSCFSNI